MRLFQSYSQDDVEEMFVRIGDFYKRYGGRPVIEAAAEVVPLWLRESLLEIAADLIPFDIHIDSDGDSTLSRMAEELRISRATANCVLGARQIKAMGMIWDETAV